MRKKYSPFVVPSVAVPGIVARSNVTTFRPRRYYKRLPKIMDGDNVMIQMREGLGLSRKQLGERRIANRFKGRT
jgi:hypothetical protein